MPSASLVRLFFGHGHPGRLRGHKTTPPDHRRPGSRRRVKSAPTTTKTPYKSLAKKQPPGPPLLTHTESTVKSHPVSPSPLKSERQASTHLRPIPIGVNGAGKTFARFSPQRYSLGGLPTPTAPRHHPWKGMQGSEYPHPAPLCQTQKLAAGVLCLLR